MDEKIKKRGVLFSLLPLEVNTEEEEGKKKKRRHQSNSAAPQRKNHGENGREGLNFLLQCVRIRNRNREGGGNAAQ